MAQKDRVVKDTGTYLFADFSKGLYYLDTPRTINEQLGSLALTGGRNIWSEKGALVSQHGYQIKYQIPTTVDENGNVVEVNDGLLYGRVITGNSKSASGVNTIFITADNGDVFLYSASEGLKKYKTNAGGESGLLHPLVTRRGTDMIVYDNEQFTMYGAYYDAESTVQVDANVEFERNNNSFNILVPEDSIKYYWQNKDIVLDGTVHAVVDSVQKTTIAKTETRTGTRIIPAGEEIITTVESLSVNGTFQIKPKTQTETAGLMVGTEAETYRTNLNERLYVMTGTLWNTGSSQSYYPVFRLVLDNVEHTIIAVNPISINDNKTYNWYLTFSNNEDYMFFNVWDNDTNTVVADTLTIGHVTNIETLGQEIYDNISTATDVSGTWYKNVSTTPTTSGHSNKSTVQTEASVENSLVTTETVITPEREEEYEYLETVEYVYGSIDGRLINATSETVFGDTVTVSEQTLMDMNIEFTPDNTGVSPPKPTIHFMEGTNTSTDIYVLPKYIAVSNNRLFIAADDGNIYYSQIGVLNGFNEAYGAGYFGGFYQDTSEVLSIEEFLEGTLICKKNGIYFLTIGDEVTIKKISQVGQQYESDHVIVGEKVFAYDTNSGAIVNAVSMNVFGSLVSGKPIVTSEYLNAENMGINSSPRALVYNAESEVFILYYGSNLSKGIVITNVGTLFPREIDQDVKAYVGFNQGVLMISDTLNTIAQDFKKGTMIPNLSCVAEFEAIGLRDNRLIINSIVEFTELNGISFNVAGMNAGYSYQKVNPSYNLGVNSEFLPPLIYSEDNHKVDSFELTTKWAEKASNITRIAAPLSGRNGVSLRVEFPANTAFCLAALRLPDFSQGV